MKKALWVFALTLLGLILYLFLTSPMTKVKGDPVFSTIFILVAIILFLGTKRQKKK
jgi:hypothetical protein